MKNKFLKLKAWIYKYYPEIELITTFIFIVAFIILVLITYYKY